MKKLQNDKNNKMNPYSGFIIIRLKDISTDVVDNLFDFAEQKEQNNLLKLLKNYESFGISTRPLIKSISRLKMRELENKETKKSLHSLTSYWRIDVRNLSEEQIVKFVEDLNDLPEVDLAYREMSVSEPSIDPSDDIYSNLQRYLDPAPTGIDARWSWTIPNGNGTGIGVIDLEQGWFPSHEDLIEKNPTLIFNDNRDGVGSYKGNHGTAVLGEIVGVDNNIGIIGIAQGVTSVRMVSHYEKITDTDLHVADAILAAVITMSAGDVLLLEVQRGGGPLPTETDAADFDAIMIAVNNGITVVEAAGNGNVDLDNWQNPWSMNNTTLNRNSPHFLDSGAIIVGAAESPLPHNRSSFSNFGSRVDCYGWGENVTTIGYGDLDPGSNDNSTYTSTFSGTSSASPIVTGAAIIVQGLSENYFGTRFSPSQIRTLLSDPSTGTSQGPDITGNIGIMPNLRAIIEKLFDTIITQVKIAIKTGNINGASTNGKIYLGIGGREFRLDKPGDQFQRNSLDTFTIGIGSDLENPDFNNLPITVNNNSPIIRHLEIISYPKYLRFDPNDDSDNWNVQNVEVDVVDIGKTYKGPRDGNLWQGTRSGLTISLN